MGDRCLQECPSHRLAEVGKRHSIQNHLWKWDVPPAGSVRFARTLAIRMNTAHPVENMPNVATSTETNKEPRDLRFWNWQWIDSLDICRS